MEKSMETKTTTWSGSPNGGKAIIEETITSEEINPKEQECESGIWEVNLTTWVKSYNRLHLVYHLHQNRLTSPYDDH